MQGNLKKSLKLPWQYCVSLGFFISFFWGHNSFSVEPQIVIHWSSLTSLGHADLLKDRDGQLLSAGSASNGDGHLVTLGYFADANSTHPFNGDWIPLTLGTRIGDSSSGYGYDDGMFVCKHLACVTLNQRVGKYIEVIFACIFSRGFDILLIDRKNEPVKSTPVGWC